MKKLSEKDKNIIICLVAVLLAVVYYMYVFTPQSEKVSQLKEESTSKKEMIEQQDQKIASKMQTENQLEQEKADVLPLAKKYFGDIKQEDLILLINKLSNDSKIDISSISFSDPEDIGFEVSEPKAEANKETPAQEESAADENAEGNDQQPAQEEKKEEPQFEGPNISHTDANISFTGTYIALSNLIKMMDQNEQKIVSNSLNISKTEPDEKMIALFGQNANDAISGSMTIQFYRVKSLDKYKTKDESILKTKPITKSTKPSPMIAYAWAIQQETQRQESSNSAYTPSVSESIKDSINIINNISDNSNVDASPEQKKYIEYKRPVELMRFDSINGFLVTPEDQKSNATIKLDKIDGIGYKIIGMDAEFSKESKLDTKIFLDLKNKKISIKEKPNSLTLSMYIPDQNGYEIGYVFTDKNGKQALLKCVDSVSFKGWKEIETNTSGIAFPATLDAIYVKRTNNDNPVNSRVLFDTLYANYVVKK